MAAVLAAISRIPRSRLLERDAFAVHAVIRSRWLRVPLDLDVRVDADAGVVHLRAATPFALRKRSNIKVRAGELLRLIERELRLA